MVRIQKCSAHCSLTGFFLVIALIIPFFFVTACAPIKNLDVWKDDAYTQSLKKVLVIALAQEDSVRKQSENVLANQLSDRGVDVLRSYKVLPDPKAKPDRETVLAIVQELGVDSVIVARSISKKEITNHQYGGVVLGGSAVYSDGGWYGYSYGFTYDRQYDTDYFIVSTKLYDVVSQNPVWSYIAQVKVDGSRQGAVNLLVPAIVEQLEASQLIKSKQK
jgi:hypothetical protein